MMADNKLVIDASVAIKWYVPELGSQEAAAVLDREEFLIAPDLLAAEFGNVLWKKVRKGELAQAEATEIIAVFTSSGSIALRPVSVYLSAAFDLAIRWNLTVYDALYLAVAIEESCPLVTADETLGRGLRGTALENSVLVLGRA